VTTTLQHIEDLDAHAWAALTKRAAAAAVAAAERLGREPPATLTLVGAMTEQQLVELRSRFGPGPERLSPVMRLVEADRSRLAAERRAREAVQDKRDADAAAAMARAEAEQSARVVTQARERARAVEAQAARQDLERADERATAQHALEEVRAELERVRADGAAEAAAAREQLSAAEARAEQRTAERTAERAAAQQALQEVRAEVERVGAEAAAEAAAAREQLSAAEARAEQRLAERAAERGAAHQAVQEVRGELERVRADAAAEVAAARGQADGGVQAAHRAAEAEVSRARAEAADAVARSHAEVERVRAEAAAEVAAAREQATGEIAAARQAAHAEVTRARAEADDARFAGAAQVASPQLLTIPVPPSGVRVHTGRIDDALCAVRRIDDVLEAGAADGVEPPGRLDVELVRSLVRTVQEQARDLSQELRDLPSRYAAQWQVDAAAEYARAAASAYGAVLQRIAAATEQLARRDEDTDAEVIELVTAMLGDHPWRRR
jgi:colicin import membrane protein